MRCSAFASRVLARCRESPSALWVVSSSMSIFHLSVKPISRSAGRSAVAAAAYRSATLLEERRSGERHDYTRKRDVVHGEIVAPAGAPSWAFDRAELWNAAEAAEKRKDARVARDYELAIPRELSREQGVELVRDFAEALVERHGVAVDFNVHRDDPRKWDGSEKGWQGYHAHVMATTRRLGPDGFGEKAAIEFNDAKRKGLGLGSGTEEIQALREVWEKLGNRHLERAGSAERLDRRSLAEQGIDREPTVHLGPYVTELERRGVASDLGNLNRDILAGRRPQAEQIQISGRGSFHALPELLAARDAELPVGELDELELRRLASDRASRVLHVIERSERREERRERALGAQSSRPWDVVKARAVQLLEQARALTKRLREALEPRRLAAWADKQLRRGLSLTREEAIRTPAVEALRPTAPGADDDGQWMRDYRAWRRAEYQATHQAGRPSPPVERDADRPAWIQAELDARLAGRRPSGVPAATPTDARERLAKKAEQLRRERGLEPLAKPVGGRARPEAGPERSPGRVASDPGLGPGRDKPRNREPER